MNQEKPSRRFVVLETHLIDFDLSTTREYLKPHQPAMILKLADKLQLRSFGLLPFFALHSHATLLQFRLSIQQKHYLNIAHLHFYP